MEVQALSPEVIQDTSISTVQQIAPNDIASTFGLATIDLLSSRLGSRVLSTSDEFFCSASNLNNPNPPIHKPNTFTENGAWYDGWETRRHNREPFDWVVFRLGVRPGRVKGVEIDTGFFNGNQAPEIAVEGCYQPGPDAPDDMSSDNQAESEKSDNTVAAAGFDGWHSILPRQPCGPACTQAWLVPSSSETGSASEDDPPLYTHIRLLMYPDGGIGRIRLYGTVMPLFSPISSDANSSNAITPSIDLASLHNGGLVTSCSDQHFSPASNLLLPGRGVDMSDGWETKRSRGPHTDWVVIKLGAVGHVDQFVVDTAFFRGNFPREVELYVAEGEEPPTTAEDGRWNVVVKGFKCAADIEHTIDAQALSASTKSLRVQWVKMVIVPDGGVKRLRVMGRRV